MSALDWRLAGPLAGSHPALVSRRLRELALTGACGILAVGGALAISLDMPHPNIALVAGLLVGAIVLFILLTSTRYEVTLTIVMIYLGLLDGPVKLLSASQAASAVRDVLLYAVALNMLVRIKAGSELKTPPLTGWVLAFAACVVVQAFNPNTGSILKIIGGFRQELEWLPLFFFGYIMMRSRDTFRKFFLVVGVIALANGGVALYQSRLSPAQVASWGPGYATVIGGTGGLAKRSYSVEGESHVRPLALSTDSGKGAGFGLIALPGLLALLAVGRLRRRWIGVALCVGALLAIATAASRTSVILLAVELISYAGLSVIAGLRVSRLLVALLVAIALVVGVVSALTSIEGSSVFQRQETLSSASSAEASGGDAKLKYLSELPRILNTNPLGSGLATGASAGGFGGKQAVAIEGTTANAASAYNLLAFEVGLPGLLVWLGLSIEVVALAVLRLRRVADPEVRTYVVAIVAVFIAYTAGGFGGPTLAGSPAGAFLWFAPGVAAYWLAGPGLSRRRSLHRVKPTSVAVSPA